MEKQAVIRIKNDRQVVKGHLFVEGEAILARKEMMGWLRFREFVGRTDGLRRLFGLLPDRSRYMVIDDRDGYPVSPYRPGRDILEKQCTAEGDDEMADRAGTFQMTRQLSAAKSNFFASSMSIAIMGIVFVTIVLLILVVSGKMGGLQFK